MHPTASGSGGRVRPRSRPGLGVGALSAADPRPGKPSTRQGTRPPRRARPRSRPGLRGAGGVAVQGRAPRGGGAQGRPAPESRLPCRAPAPRSARRPASEQPLTLGVRGAPYGFQAAHPDLQAPRSAPGLPATGPGCLLGDPEPPPPESARFRGAPAQEPSPAAK